MLHECLLFILGRKCPFYTKDGLGILESPNFPGEYPAGAECHWRVRPGRNKRVLVIISNIELDENCGDVLTIRKTGNDFVNMKSMNSHRYRCLNAFSSNSLVI